MRVYYPNLNRSRLEGVIVEYSRAFQENELEVGTARERMRVSVLASTSRETLRLVSSLHRGTSLFVLTEARSWRLSLDIFPRRVQAPSP